VRLSSNSSRARFDKQKPRATAGREPHDGDFSGARYGTRLNDEYWERQKTLEAAVQDARKRLDDAQQGR
jgi:hypothetical protein